MFCPNCGNKLDDTALFCGACGTKVERVEVPVEEVPEVVAPEEITPEVVAPEDAEKEVAAPEEVAADDTTQPGDQQSAPAGNQQSAPAGNQTYQQAGNQTYQQAGPGGYQQGQQYYQPQQPKKPAIDLSKVDKFWFVIAGEALLAIIMIIVFFAVNISMTSPKNVAKRYLDAVCKADYETAYKYLATDDSDFMTKDSYVKLHQDAKPSTAQYKVIGVNKGEDKAAVSLSRTYGGTTNDYINSLFSSTTTVTLTRQNKNRMLLFKNWKVSDSSDITSEIELKAPVGSTVYIDGIEVKSKYLTDTTSEYDIYTIPSMFTGTHTYSLTIDKIESAPCEFSLYAGSKSITCSNIKFSQEDQQKLAKVAFKNMTDLLDALNSNTAYSDQKVRDLLTVEAYKRYANSYDSCLKYYNGSDGYAKIESVKLSDVTATTNSMRMSNGNPAISFRMSFVDVNTGIRSGILDPVSGSTEARNMTAYVTIQYENGKWKLSDFPVSSISYNTSFQAA